MRTAKIANIQGLPLPSSDAGVRARLARAFTALRQLVDRCPHRDVGLVPYPALMQSYVLGKQALAATSNSDSSGSRSSSGLEDCLAAMREVDAVLLGGVHGAGWTAVRLPFEQPPRRGMAGTAVLPDHTNAVVSDAAVQPYTSFSLSGPAANAAAAARPVAVVCADAACDALFMDWLRRAVEPSTVAGARGRQPPPLPLQMVVPFTTLHALRHAATGPPPTTVSSKSSSSKTALSPEEAHAALVLLLSLATGQVPSPAEVVVLPPTAEFELLLRYREVGASSHAPPPTTNSAHRLQHLMGDSTARAAFVAALAAPQRVPAIGVISSQPSANVSAAVARAGLIHTPHSTHNSTASRPCASRVFPLPTAAIDDDGLLKTLFRSHDFPDAGSSDAANKGPRVVRVDDSMSRRDSMSMHAAAQQGCSSLARRLFARE